MVSDSLVQIFWRDAINLQLPGGAEERVHARRTFYGRPRYDILQIHGEGMELWYARAMAFFDVCVESVWHRMALIHWMQPVAETHVPGAVTFRYWAMHPDVIQVHSIARSARMVTSPRRIGLDEENVCFVLLPYGKWSAK